MAIMNLKTDTSVKNWRNIIDLAKTNWISQTSSFDPSLVRVLYKLISEEPKALVYLETTNYTEKYLWHHNSIFFSSPSKNERQATNEYMMSIISLMAHQSQQNSDFWLPYETGPSGENLKSFLEFAFAQIHSKLGTNSFTITEENHIVQFLMAVFSNLEIETLRESSLKFLSIEIWSNIAKTKFEGYFSKFPNLKKEYLNRFSGDAIQNGLKTQRNFVPNFLNVFFQRLLAFEDTKFDKICTMKKEILNIELNIEFLTDLMAQIETRRYLRFLLLECHFSTVCRMSQIAKWAGKNPRQTSLLNQLTVCEHFLDFEIDDETGELLSDKELETQHCIDLALLQRIAFKHFPKSLKGLAMAPISSIESEKGLRTFLAPLKAEELTKLAEKLCLLPISQKTVSSEFSQKRNFLTEIVTKAYGTRRRSVFQTIRNLSLYPDESLLWDNNFLPSYQRIKGGRFDGPSAKRFALPKLNLQFLTLQDYLSRNFQLYRLEAAYQIREEIGNVLYQLEPTASVDKLTGDKRTVFMGYSRMAVPVRKAITTKLGKPHVGHSKPSVVRVEIEVDLRPFKNTRNEIVFREWETLRKHDVLLACKIDASLKEGTEELSGANGTRESFGLKRLRGCEIVEVKDERYLAIGSRDKEGNQIEAEGTVRTFVVEFDCAQYEEDLRCKKEGVYSDFNLIVRRKPKANNFKAVLGTIRDMIDDRVTLPQWMRRIFIGESDLKSGRKKGVKMDFHDTFTGEDHLRRSFPGYEIDVAPGTAGGMFELEFDTAPSGKKRIRASASRSTRRRNNLEYTRTQAEMIRSGGEEGLTLVIGPPGTGKTDCAVQIVNNLYQSHPNERVLIITHSNAALNDIFEKIVQKSNVEEKHLLRLGYGYKELETEENFGRVGRISHIMKKRQDLLAEIGRLFRSIGFGDGSGFTCENAFNLFFYHIQSRWEEFVQKFSRREKVRRGEPSANFVRNHFPFVKFFTEGHLNEPNFELFEAGDDEKDMEKAEGLFAELQRMIRSAEEFQPLETLRNRKDRGDFLAVSFSRVVAMTCTHAAMKRGELKRLGFQFDSLVVEEAAQMLDVEAFISIALQWPKNKLKRLVLIGDHFQLPPVIQNIALKRTFRLDQSLFTRLVRLRVPSLQLDLQGRARPELAALFSWRYPNLGNLHGPEKFPSCNPAILHPFQFVNVEDFKGVGETAPAPHFYQNLGEAEYMVALYMFLRLQGYPREKIVLLATYNGQRQLLRDIVRRRCEGTAHARKLYGRPFKVSTVDKFQGRQSDFVLLSLVRTSNPGHLRDVRRLIVALSRARLGLYVFGRRNLLERIFEVREATEKLLKNGDKLQLVRGEQYSEEDMETWERKGESFVVRDVCEMGEIVAREAAQKSKRKFEEWEENMEQYKRLAESEQVATNK